MKVDLRDYFPDSQNALFKDETNSGRVSVFENEATFLPDEVVTHLILFLPIMEMKLKKTAHLG